MASDLGQTTIVITSTGMENHVRVGILVNGQLTEFEGYLQNNELKTDDEDVLWHDYVYLLKVNGIEGFEVRPA